MRPFTLRSAEPIEQHDRQADRASASAGPLWETWRLQCSISSDGLKYGDPPPLPRSSSPKPVPWAAHALPSVIALTGLPADLAGPSLQLSPHRPGSSVATDGAEHLLAHRGTVFRVPVGEDSIEPSAVILPLDQFFENRAIAAMRLWRGLAGRNPGLNPAALPKTRRDRLILALRALDGRLADATYRERAVWRSRSVLPRMEKAMIYAIGCSALVRFGLGMLRSDYRRLLLYPCRRR